MAIILTAADDEAEGLTAELYDDDLRTQGYVASHTRAMAVNPDAVVAFENLIRAIVAQMDVRRYELVTLAAARGTRSAHCRLAHGAKTAGLGVLTEQQLIEVATDYRSASALSPAEVAMMQYAERVSTDAATMTDADSRRLREHGFTDREIVDITLAAAVRSYYSKAIQALAVDVDVPPALTPALRAALLSGL